MASSQATWLQTFPASSVTCSLHTKASDGKGPPAASCRCMVMSVHGCVVWYAEGSSQLQGGSGGYVPPCYGHAAIIMKHVPGKHGPTLLRKCRNHKETCARQTWSRSAVEMPQSQGNMCQANMVLLCTGIAATKGNMCQANMVPLCCGHAAIIRKHVPGKHGPALLRKCRDHKETRARQTWMY
eukprot:577926-Pelagomonas_calceolata.AAC.9